MICFGALSGIVAQEPVSPRSHQGCDFGDKGARSGDLHHGICAPKQRRRQLITSCEDLHTVMHKAVAFCLVHLRSESDCRTLTALIALTALRHSLSRADWLHAQAGAENQLYRSTHRVASSVALQKPSRDNFYSLLQIPDWGAKMWEPDLESGLSLVGQFSMFALNGLSCL